MVEVKWTLQSIDDINNIAEYIAKDSVRYAEIQVTDFFESAMCLEEFPKIGRMVPEVGDINLRELIVGSYRIKSIKTVDILTVYHAKRLLTKKKIRKLR